MIIKGDSRGGPVQLARHLLRTDTNETVNIVQLDSPTGSLREALRDWQLISAGTRGSKGLYHANISPDARYAMTPEQWQRAVDVLEKELGFDGQPRVVVVHEKHDRQHIHVVWQRTDIDTMTLVSDSFNYVAHERASLALEQEFGHEHVPGKHAKRDRVKQPEFPKAEINHAEWQQAERAGVDAHAFKDAITSLYAHSDNGQAFQAALEGHGFVLAKGDRRNYVIVDADGQVYSLARQIKGVAEKDLRTFMADVDRESRPSVEQAKALQEERGHALEIAPDHNEADQPTPPQPSTPEPADLPPMPQPADRTIEETAALERALRERHAEESSKLRLRQEAEYQQTARVLEGESREKLGHFDALQRAARERFLREADRARIGFIEAIRAKLDPRQAAEDARLRQEAVDAFQRRQEKEREDRIAALKSGERADLANLTERHEQQQREHNAGYDSERARYRRELDGAAKRLAEIAERRRRQEEVRVELERSRDGRPPPGRAR
jgi:Relaxase/Mobilisation nuclease domain